MPPAGSGRERGAAARPPSSRARLAPQCTRGAAAGSTSVASASLRTPAPLGTRRIHSRYTDRLCLLPTRCRQQLFSVFYSDHFSAIIFKVSNNYGISVPCPVFVCL